jgi:CRISPR-associated protein Cmr6
MANSNEVPLMFQAQISGRGQIQYIQKPEQSERWVDEWLEATAINAPNFSHHVKTQEYKISWRLLSNSGQDDDFIRPVIAANGFPYYPGASMKGAFLRHCTPQQAIRYCGGKNLTPQPPSLQGNGENLKPLSLQERGFTDSETQPGILRFHGAFPKDSEWKEEPLIDVVHPQQNWQVKNSDSHSAFLQISLYAPTLVFGISSTIELNDSEWKTIWSIWDKAIERGIGSRVSAGYGQPINHPETKLFSVSLKGQGLASKLIGTEQIEEFRPNMFKAALRGNSLRLFSAVTDENTAEELTKELWGGFAGAKGAIVGDLGIAFHAEKLVMDEFTYNNHRVSMPTYDLKKGDLTILCMKNRSEEYRKQLRILAKAILKFALLIGGFGKSSRRVDHRIFFPEYLEPGNKPMIGCQWGFTKESESYYFPVNNIKHIKNIIDDVYKVVNSWLVFKGKSQNYQKLSWRESFHPENVQVWGRIAEDEDDSLAVRWFHGNYKSSQSIKRSKLTGEIGKIGRIYHRMYPHYIRTKDGEMKKKGRGYVELLTIFPDKTDQTTKDFLAFLPASGFEKLWGV